MIEVLETTGESRTRYAYESHADAALHCLRRCTAEEIGRLKLYDLGALQKSKLSDRPIIVLPHPLEELEP